MNYVYIIDCLRRMNIEILQEVATLEGTYVKLMNRSRKLVCQGCLMKLSAADDNSEGFCVLKY